MRVAVSPSTYWRRSPLGSGVGRWRAALLAVLALLLVFGSTMIGLGVVLGALALIGGLSLIVWQRPLLGAAALIILGTFHQFVMLLIFHLTGNGVLVKLAQIWKEIIVVVLLLRVIDLAFRRRRAPSVYLLDLLIVFFLAYAGLYLAYPSALEESSIITAILGLRADTFFLLAYFIGRGLPIRLVHVRVALVIFSGIAIIIALAAAAQFVLPGLANAFIESLSFSEYLEIQRGAAGLTNSVRANVIAGAVIPRASSFFLADLALAFYTMLAFPLATALFITLGGLRRKLLANVLLLAMLATTVLTVTRSAIIALVPILAVLTIWSRTLLLPVLVALELMAVAIPVAFYLDLTPSVIRAIVSPNEASTQAHLRAIDLSLEVLREAPFGRGLGTSGPISQRLNPAEALTNESWYLQVATEMGIIAGLVFAAILVGFGLIAFRQYTRVRDPWLQALCLGMGGATIGFGIVSATLHAWDNLTVSIIFWLFAGVVVRAPTMEREELDANRRLA